MSSGIGKSSSSNSSFPHKRLSQPAARCNLLPVTVLYCGLQHLKSGKVFLIRKSKRIRYDETILNFLSFLFTGAKATVVNCFVKIGLKFTAGS
jgi:hypothetical protein